MKRIFCLLLLAFPLALSAHNDVTTFLGIPVDGTKAEMKRKLISKGFQVKKILDEEFLEGEFNGTDVEISIVTNNNKVCRIVVSDKYSQGEAGIKTRFNNLVEQFKNNKRYVGSESQIIPDDVDISYEMSVNNKEYTAIFFQLADPKKVDSSDFELIYQELLKKFTPEQIDNDTEEVEKETNELSSKIFRERTSNKVVWFRIIENRGKYFISMFYDNEYNHANGEDL